MRGKAIYPRYGERRRIGATLGAPAHNKWTSALIKGTSHCTFLRTPRCIPRSLLIRPDPFQLGRGVTLWKRLRARLGLQVSVIKEIGSAWKNVMARGVAVLL